MENIQLQQLVQSISNEVFMKPFIHTATFNDRLRTTGGRYMLRSSNIEINPRVFQLHGMVELEGVIRHELCHYHLHREGKGYKHGDSDFKELMKKTNSPRYCATLQTKEVKKEYRLHRYVCVSCNLQYTRKRQMNVLKYVCGKCRGRLKQIK